MNSSDTMANTRNIPTAPLPNPGEGGPVFPDGNPGNIPVAPLPNPGEGGPVYPGGSGGSGNNGGNIPVIPLPNPGEGGPVYPGNPGQTLPIFPVPNPPCFFCNSYREGQVRFLHAAFGYMPFRISINNRLIVNGLDYTSLTSYGSVANGFQTVTVTGQDGYIYLQKSMPFKAGEKSTIAIINTANGIDLLQISDIPCNKAKNMSCFRVCNLAYYSNPVDLILYDGRVVYSDVRYKEVTSFKRIQPGSYEFYLAETNMQPMPRFEDIETQDSSRYAVDMQEALVSFYVDVSPNSVYTVYILNWNDAPDAIQTMIVEDHL